MSDVRPIDANDLKRDFAELCATECAICSFYISSADVGDCHCGLIDRAPTVETYTKDDMTKEYLKGYNACKDTIQPTGEWIEIKHELHLLMGVLYSNQLISDSDLEYIEDSIKKLMKGEEE